MDDPQLRRGVRVRDVSASGQASHCLGCGKGYGGLDHDGLCLLGSPAPRGGAPPAATEDFSSALAGREPSFALLPPGGGRSLREDASMTYRKAGSLALLAVLATTGTWAYS